MAGAGFKDFTAGSILTASQVDTYLMHQAVMRFTTTSAADTAIGANKAEGMVVFATSTDTLHIYNGAAWIPVAQALGSGTGYMGAWQGYTPTFSNLSVGNGTTAFTYVQQGKTVHVRGRISLGTTSTVTGLIAISLPVTAVSSNFVASITGRAGGTDHILYAASTTTTLSISAVTANGAYTSRANTSATVPGTWTNGDNITFSATYEAA
jgi:hypothetical protein